MLDAELIDSLPVAVYLVGSDGQFLYANRKLCGLLRIPSDAITQYNLSDYYAHPEDRDPLVAEVEAGDTLEKRLVTFLVDDEEIQVQMFCRALPNTNAGRRRLLGVLVEFNEGKLHRLFDSDLLTGVYRLDKSDRITEANLRFAKIHGYDSVDDVKGLEARAFYASPADADQTRERILKQESLKDEPVILKKRDGTLFDAYLTAIPLFNRQGDYDGRGGIVTDRTREREYQQVFDEVPLGFYVIKCHDDQEELVDCNGEFARIFEVPSPEDIKGKDVRDFHYSPEETRRLSEKLLQAARSGMPVADETFRIRTAKGNVKTIEVHARPQLRGSQITGRIGAVRDVTKELEMQNVISSLQTDIGAILHLFRHTLQPLKLTLGAVAEVLAGKSQIRPTVRAPEQLAGDLRGSIKDLLSAVTSLLQTARATVHNKALSDADLITLERMALAISRCESEVDKPLWRDVWRAAAVEIEGVCKKIRPGVIARSVYRPVVVAAQRIAAVTALATLAESREAIIAVESPIHALSESLSAGSRRPEDFERCAVEGCVTEAIARVSAFADERRVQIRFDDHTRTFVRAVRYDITRAIQNLLHNAIKYSWQREDGRTWVSVSVNVSEYAMAVLLVEDWGVPVPADEIESGLVFRFGFRGRFSSDRGRMGTGVGLADSMSVARAHGGRMSIESRPARQSSSPLDYKQPFVTKVTIELPLAQ